MNFDKKLIMALALAVVILVFGSLALAITMAITVTNPTNNTIITSTVTNINATTDNVAKECKYQLNWANGVAGANLTMNNMTSNMTWGATNSTMTIDGNYNVTVFCMDSWANWTKSSTTHFSVETNTNYSVTWVVPAANNSYSNSNWLWFNLTLNASAANVSANFSQGSEVSRAFHWFGNTSTTAWYLNATGFNGTQTKINDTINFAANDTWYAVSNRNITGALVEINNLTDAGLPLNNFTYNSTHIKIITEGYLALGIYNVTYNYRDEWGDGVKNITITIRDMGTAGQNDTTQAVRTFTIDTVKPMVQNVSISSKADGTLNLTYRVTDTNYAACGARVHSLNWGGSFTEYNSSIARYNNTPGGEETLCYVNITGTNLLEGELTVEPRGYDLAGNINNTLNQTKWLYNKLYTTAGWNFLGSVVNESATELANRSSLIRKVSWFNNTDKTWSTFNKNSLSKANENVSLNISDGFLVSVDSNTGIFRHIDGGGITRNITVSFGWNLVASQNSTLTTLYNKAKESLFNSSTHVIKRLDFYNATSSNPHISYRVDWNITGLNTSYEIVRGISYWLAANITTGFSNATTTGPSASGALTASNATYISVKG